MPPVIIENPILNSPFDEPTKHFRFDDENNITADVAEGRRESSYFMPIAAPKKKGKQSLFDDDFADEKKEESARQQDPREGQGVAESRLARNHTRYARAAPALDRPAARRAAPALDRPAARAALVLLPNRSAGNAHLRHSDGLHPRHARCVSRASASGRDLAESVQCGQFFRW